MRSEFVGRYAAVYEHSPWVAEQAAGVCADLDDADRIADIMADCVDNASGEQQLALIQAHPDLADRAHRGDDLTAASRDEQSGVGLDQCTAQEYSQFQQLNQDYKDKFGFPFVLAVRGRTRREILKVFAQRLDHDYATEFEAALEQIHAIARLRINALGQI